MLEQGDKYEVYYTLNIDKNYTFNKAKIYFYKEGLKQSDIKVLCAKNGDDCDDIINQNEKYHGKLNLSSLGTENKISLEEVEICNSEGKCSISNITTSFKFFGD